jgi:predicted O-linked N-acetylglucosamine transferase (SPINDLY family)
MIAQSLPAYEALALRMARDPAAFREVKSRLASHRATHAVFDTARYTRNLEAAYLTMWERSRS